MTSNLPSRPGRERGRAPLAVPSARAGGTDPLWRVATPGVCRLVDDPEQLARLVQRHPDASIARVPRGRPS